MFRREVKISNVSKKIVLGENFKVANTFCTRLKGLIGIEELHQGEGLILYPCNSIHTCFMSIPIDVIFINRDDMVIKISENVKAWRVLSIVPKAHKAIEMRAGSTKSSTTTVGDKIHFSVVI